MSYGTVILPSLKGAGGTSLYQISKQSLLETSKQQMKRLMGSFFPPLCEIKATYPSSGKQNLKKQNKNQTA